MRSVPGCASPPHRTRIDAGAAIARAAKAASSGDRRSQNGQKPASLMSPADFDMDDDPREQISELEEQIEELAGALERCRKTALASKAAMVLGAILLAAIILGVVAFDPMAMVAALAALLGGIVVFGSNNSTSHQLSQSMKNAEALRAALIGRLDIRLVGDASANRHPGKYH
jgi:hypothetical protein